MKRYWNSYNGTNCTVQYMEYGIVRIQARETIISALNEHEKLRFGKLQKIVVVEKKACSERIFREILDEFVQKKIIKKYVIARNNTIYTINSEITTISDVQVDEFIESIENIKIGTDGILQTISSDADDATKADEVIKFLHWISMYEMELMMFSRVLGKRKLTTMAKEVSKYKKQVLDSLSIKGSSSFDLLGGLVYTRLFTESFRLDPKMLVKFVEDFNEAAKDIMKKRKQNKN